MFEDEFEGQVDEYKATEIENQAFRNIAQFIKTEPGKSDYEKQKKMYMNLGENNYMSFMFNMAEMSNWVNDMALKEKVYKEIHEFENEEN